jgi:hypothetical protein
VFAFANFAFARLQKTEGFLISELRLPFGKAKKATSGKGCSVAAYS